MKTANSHPRYDTRFRTNRVPSLQIELKPLGIRPRRAMEQSVDSRFLPAHHFAAEDKKKVTQLAA